MHDKDIISDIARRQQSGEEFCVVTVVRAIAATAAKAGSKAVVNADGDIISGFIGGACVKAAVARTAKEALRAGQARLIRVKPADEVSTDLDADGVKLHKSGCPSRGTLDIFVEPMNPAPQICIIGTNPVAVALAEQALLLGYRVLAIAAASGDNTAKFPAAVRAQTQLELAEGDIGDKDYIVIATQGQGDLAALKTALATPAHYVSMVCSRAKARSLTAALEKDSPHLSFENFKAPAGLDIQAIEPREIALSILAEIIQHRRRDSRLTAGQ